jgi:hypothetical protein
LLTLTAEDTAAGVDATTTGTATDDDDELRSAKLENAETTLVPELDDAVVAALNADTLPNGFLLCAGPCCEDQKLKTSTQWLSQLISYSVDILTMQKLTIQSPFAIDSQRRRLAVEFGDETAHAVESARDTAICLTTLDNHRIPMHCHRRHLVVVALVAARSRASLASDCDS